jgi:hypothetical protein
MCVNFVPWENRRVAVCAYGFPCALGLVRVRVTVAFAHPGLRRAALVCECVCERLALCVSVYVSVAGDVRPGASDVMVNELRLGLRASAF